MILAKGLLFLAACVLTTSSFADDIMPMKLHIINHTTQPVHVHMYDFNSTKHYRVNNTDMQRIFIPDKDVHNIAFDYAYLDGSAGKKCQARVTHPKPSKLLVVIHSDGNCSFAAQGDE